MNILCEIFGHKPPGYARQVGGEYMDFVYFVTDGIGRRHAVLYGECPRCKEIYEVGKTHIPEIKEMG